MADHALIVGIEVYPTEFAATLQGPALDAMRFASWLHRCQRVPAPNIRLLCAPSPTWQGELLAQYEQTREELRRVGIVPRATLGHLEIMSAFETELLSGPLEDGTLWIYWSGHGVTFPGGRDCVLCGDLQNGQPTLVYLQEIRDALRSRKFRRYRKQFLIVDACSEYVDPAKLRMHKLPGMGAWTVTESPEQVELSAVPTGKRAQAGVGGSVFSSTLLGLLKDKPWPDDIADFHKQLCAEVLNTTHDPSLAPSVRILTPTWAIGYESETNRRVFNEMVALLSSCTIDFQAYRPLYARTVSTLCQGLEMVDAATVPQIVEALLDLQPEPEFGGHSHALVQFLLRVVRKYASDAEPIQAWLNNLPKGSLTSLQAELARERGRLLLLLEVAQVNRASANEYPVRLSATLTDGSFSSVLGQWPEEGHVELRTKAELEQKTREFLQQALDTKPDDDQGVDVHVFADVCFFGYPWHTLSIDPADPETTFSEHLGFVLRWRERRSRTARLFAPAWRKRSDRLRHQPCRKIPILEASALGQTGDADGPGEGLILFPSAVSQLPRTGLSPWELMILRELKRGLSLASWPLSASTGQAERETPEKLGRLQRFFAKAGLRMLDAIPEALMDERSNNPWARDTVVLLDLAPSSEALDSNFEEAHQL